MSAVLYKHSGEVIQVTPKNGKVFDLEELQEMVEGYIEIFSISEDHQLVLNEEGKIQGLPRNAKATEMFYNFLQCDLVGNVLACPASALDDDDDDTEDEMA